MKEMGEYTIGDRVGTQHRTALLDEWGMGFSWRVGIIVDEKPDTDPIFANGDPEDTGTGEILSLVRYPSGEEIWWPKRYLRGADFCYGDDAEDVEIIIEDEPRHDQGDQATVSTVLPQINKQTHLREEEHRRALSCSANGNDTTTNGDKEQ